MLSITRKENERIVIRLDGEKLLEIVVSRTRSGSVRLAFEAPQRVSIDRSEIDERKRAA